MSQSHHFPFGGASHRIIRAYTGVGLTIILGLAAILWWLGRFFSTIQSAAPLSGIVIDAIVLVGLGLYLLWTSYLSLCNVFVTTARISVSPDQIQLSIGRGWTSTVSREHIHGDAAVAVLYRLGAARSILRIRKRPAPAIFVPVSQLSSFSPMFRMVARMYVGKSAAYGFLITPDHVDREQLLDLLSINKGASHE